MGTEPENISPYHHLAGKLPPTIIFHGTNDKAEPFKTIKLFTDRIHEFGNKCTLVACQDKTIVSLIIANLKT